MNEAANRHAARSGATPASRHALPRPLAGLLLLPLLLLCVAGGGCARNRAPSGRFVEQAQRLHEGALAAAVIPNRDLNDYVQEVGKRLEAAAREVAPDKARGPFFQSLRFHLVDSPVVNAFPTGGSHVYVYRGLFEFCTSEEELAAAMAHAYAHALNLDFEGTGMVPGPPNRPLSRVAWDFVQARFTQLQEQEADRLAFLLYARAGWDPARWEVLFGRVSDAFPGPAAADRDPAAARGGAARETTAGVSRRWRKLPVADARTFASLKKRAGSLLGQSDATVEARLFLLAFPNCILSDDLDVQRKAQDKLRPPPPAAVEVEPS